MLTLHDIGVARQSGKDGDAIEVSPGTRWLLTSGTPWLAVDGRLPGDVAGQAEIAWRHIVSMLERAGMTVHDVVKRRASRFPSRQHGRAGEGAPRRIVRPVEAAPCGADRRVATAPGYGA